MSGSVGWHFTLGSTSEINRALSGPDGPVTRAILQRTLRVEAAAKRLAKADQGRLRGSITHRIVRRDNDGVSVPVGEVGTDVEYAEFVHQGTGIYGPNQTPIVPVRASVLRWTDRQGNVIYARSVRGQEPNPFLTDALEEGMR